MKRIIAVAVIGLALTGWAEENGIRFDLTGSGRYTIPRKEGYKNGLGAEGWMRLWFNDYLGIGAVGAVERWGINKDKTPTTNKNPAIYPVSMGGSALLRIPLNDSLHIIGHGGVRFVPIASDVEIGNEKTEWDPAILGVAGGSMEATVAKNLFIFGGASYQFELTTPDVKAKGQKITEAHLGGTTIYAGLGIHF